MSTPSVHTSIPTSKAHAIGQRTVITVLLSATPLMRYCIPTNATVAQRNRN